MKYESPISYGQGANAKVNTFLKEGQTSRSLGQNKLVPLERSCHKECAFDIWKSYFFWLGNYDQG